MTTPDPNTKLDIGLARAGKFMNKNFSKTKEKGIDTIVISFKKALASENESAEQELEEYKNDFRGMIVGSISSIKQHCENILNNLDKEYVAENLTEPFLQSQIAIAEDYVVSMHNYVMFNEREDEDMEAEAAKKGLWDNIRKKKKRMGKNYKPAKPGSPDRPSKEAWEKAQKQ